MLCELGYLKTNTLTLSVLILVIVEYALWVDEFIAHDYRDTLS